MSEVIKVGSLYKKYGSKCALDNITLAVEKGETLALIGPNGAGKTTFIESLLGLKEPDSGSLEIFGENIIGGKKTYLERVGAHLQEVRLFPKVTPRDFLVFFSDIYPKTIDINELISMLELSAFIDEKIGNLSGGMRQRVSLALAMINDPDLILLDEPTVGLDPIARQDFWQLIIKLKNAGKTIVFTTHYMEEATTLADRVIMINSGKVIFDGPSVSVTEKAEDINGSLDLAYAHYANASNG